jgi:Domain of unknown function (DUF4783)
MLPPIFAAVALFMGSVFLQGDSDRMVKLFGAGDAEQISGYFNPSIQLTTPGKEGVYSKSQAKMILTDFFSSNAATSASLKSKGNSDNGAQFIQLSLVTAKGNYTVNIYYRGSGAKMLIHELKIEK